MSSDSISPVQIRLRLLMKSRLLEAAQFNGCFRILRFKLRMSRVTRSLFFQSRTLIARRLRPRFQAPVAVRPVPESGIVVDFGLVSVAHGASEIALVVLESWAGCKPASCPAHYARAGPRARQRDGVQEARDCCLASAPFA